jgi:hypothetical protein
MFPSINNVLNLIVIKYFKLDKRIYLRAIAVRFYYNLFVQGNERKLIFLFDDNLFLNQYYSLTDQFAFPRRWPRPISFVSPLKRSLKQHQLEPGTVPKG